MACRRVEGLQAKLLAAELRPLVVNVRNIGSVHRAATSIWP